ncbi:uncharacterized protein [Typha latifolia]|uniref:uncharacterized protein n=1 Tax=Typha latifolia TaxID=4733 RepID=UPI003C2D4956
MWSQERASGLINPTSQPFSIEAAEYRLGAVCEESFRELKRRLTSAPILIVPRSGGGCQVYCDASHSGLGYVLMKANVVIDTLSRKSMGNLASLITRQQGILRDLQKMDMYIIAKDVGAGLLALLEIDSVYLMWVNSVRGGSSLDPYSVHPGETKMYYDVKIEHQRPAGTLRPFPIPKWKWEHITMDFVVGLSKTLKKIDSIWVIVDRLAKLAHFFPVSITNSIDHRATLFRDEIFARHGAPVSITSD